MTIGIYLDPTEGIYVLEGNGPVQTKKYLELDDLRDIFVQNISLETGILPKGCQYYLRQDGKTIVILELAPASRRILYRSGGRITDFDIPCPNTVFGLLFEGGTLRNSYCAVSKLPITGTNSELFRFPFGNVYGDARICWGNAQIPAIRNTAEASGIPVEFFEAPFNGDLSGDANGYDGDLREFFNHLNRKEHFPVNTLVTCGMRTLQDMITRLKRDAGLN